MAKNKTFETDISVEEYLDKIVNEKRRKDCTEIIALIQDQTGLQPKMWGTGIVGFGSYHYKYESGHEGDAPLTGLAARTNAITLYLGADFSQREELLKKFGKYKAGKACIYIQKNEDIDLKILGKLVTNSVKNIRQLHS